ncbi:MAG: thioredoxin [Pirellulaceae bacterium]|nr:MAG: thioredoxin [Pirellulaceae bacterium]
MASTLVALWMAVVGGVSPDCTVLHFTANWCTPCQQWQPTLERLRKEGWDIRAVDADQHQQYVQAYQVTNLPTLVILYQGKEVDRIVGLMPYDHVRQRLQRVASRSQPRYGGGEHQRRASAATPQGGPVVRGQSPGMGTAAAALVAATASPVPTGASHLGRSEPPPMVASGPPGTTPASPPISVDQAIARAARATVRIRVEEAHTIAHGTGTVIDTHGSEALVLTCGHLFRDMQPSARISVDLFAGTSQEVNVPAQLIDFEATDTDIGLISFHMPVYIEPVPILPRGERIQVGQPAFSFGCDHGKDPTRRDTRITQLNRFIGAANVEIEGAPAIGRSGGGLFDLQGRLIGVCNAADPESDQGIYAAAEVVYAQLHEIQLDHLFQPERPSQPTTPSPAPQAQVASATAPLQQQGAPTASTASTSIEGFASVTPQEAPTAQSSLPWPDETLTPNAPHSVPTTTSQATEVICIVRGADGQDRVVRIPTPDAALVQQLEQFAR